MTDVITYIYECRYHPDPINDTDHHQARVNDARERLGERFLCHPANRIKPLWRGPCANTQA